jgi:two-component system response regulator
MTMSAFEQTKPVEVLLVEDNPGDVLLTRRALHQNKLQITLSVVADGEEALQFLARKGKYANAPRPDLVLLDLNLPRKDGREVLAIIKADPILRTTPVVILTSSEAEEDVLRAYHLNANCYVQKPLDLDQFTKVVQTIESFWFTVVKLPTAA